MQKRLGSCIIFQQLSGSDEVTQEKTLYSGGPTAAEKPETSRGNRRWGRRCLPSPDQCGETPPQQQLGGAPLEPDGAGAEVGDQRVLAQQFNSRH